jgi:peptidoglycan/LPS O-acetylase OafA/YrhL
MFGHFHCMGHIWYLSSEFIMVWFTPIFFLMYLVNPICGVLSTTIGLLVGVISSAYVTNEHNLGLDMGKYYYKAYARCGVYFIGFGYGLLCSYLEKVRQDRGLPDLIIKPWTSTFLQAFGCGLFGLLVSLPHWNIPNGVQITLERGYVQEWDLSERIAWNALSRPLWGFGLSVLCFSMLYGPRRGIIPNILSWSFWGPISKLSYSAYLIHYPLYNLRIATLGKNYQHFTSFENLEIWLGITAISLFAALWIWLLVEAPFATLSKLLVSYLQTSSRNRSESNRLEQPILSREVLLSDGASVATREYTLSVQ